MDVSKLHEKHQKAMEDIIKSPFFPPAKKQEMYEFYLELSKVKEKDWVKRASEIEQAKKIVVE